MKIYEYKDNIKGENNYEYSKQTKRHSSYITWDGKFYWDKSHYEEIWKDLKNCRFIEKELDEDF